MELTYVALFTVAVSSGLGLVRAFVNRKSGVAVGWTAIFAVLFALSIAGYFVAPDILGPVAGGAWLLLVLAPSLLMQGTQRALTRQAFGRARLYARIAAVLHPADHLREQPRFLLALERLQAGDRDGAKAILEALLQSKSPSMVRAAHAQLLRLRFDWEGLCEWVERELGDDGLGSDPSFLAIYLRALGECRGPEALARVYLRFEPLLAGANVTAVSDMGRLFFFAFAGRKDLVERMFAGPLASFTEPLRRFWLATAELAAGRPVTALVEFEQLRDTSDPVVQAGVERRLAQSLPALGSTLSPQSAALIERLSARLGDEERYGDRPHAPQRTYGLHAVVAVLCAVFLVEVVRGGSTDPQVLVDLGAYWPSLVLDEHQWWRLGAYALLHAGPLHLAMNVMGLYVLGPFVERALGTLRFLLVFVLASVGGGAVALLLYAEGLVPTQLLVGASGGVMGMVGATAAVLVRGRLRDKSGVASQRLGSVALLVAVQVAFDLSTPQVSFTAHASGLVLGFLVTLGLEPRWRRARG